MASDDSTKKAGSQEEEWLARAQRWNWWLLVVITVGMAYGCLRGNWTAFHAVVSVSCLWTLSVGWQLKAMRRQNEAMRDRQRALDERDRLLNRRQESLEQREALLIRREEGVTRRERARTEADVTSAMTAMAGAFRGLGEALRPCPKDSLPKPAPPSVYDRLMEDD